MWSWKQSPELMARLATAQGRLGTPIDITTFGYMCQSEAQLKKHVEFYEDRVSQQERNAHVHPTLRGVVNAMADVFGK